MDSIRAPLLLSHPAVGSALSLVAVDGEIKSRRWQDGENRDRIP